MGLFDKIKDNAKTISMKAIESTREYDEDYLAAQAAKEEAEARRNAAAEVSVQTAAAADPITTAKSQTEQVNETETPADTKDTENNKEPEAKPEEEKTEEKPARKSRITEVPKEEANKPKTSYTPHYKADKKKDAKPESGNEEVEVKKGKKSDTEKPSAKKPSRPQIQPAKNTIIDIAPKKPEDNVKKAIYARERATMAALSTQRRLSGSVPLYTTTHMKFKARVFINRVEYSGTFGKTVVPVENISWVKLRHGGTGVILETSDSKRVVIVVKPADRLAFADAVIKIQSMVPKKGHAPDTRTVRIDQLEKFGEGIDEIEKLAKLYDKGIITEQEFEAKKKQILGI